MKGNYKIRLWFAQFCELGDYEDLHYFFNTEEEADKWLSKQFGRNPSGFGFVAKVTNCRREEEMK